MQCASFRYIFRRAITKRDLLMIFSQDGFREFYRNFCVIPLDENLKETVKEFPNAENAKYILAFGYIDRECGFTFEVIACAHKENNLYCFEDTNPRDRVKIRLTKELANADLDIIDDEDGELFDRYIGKLENLKVYIPSEDIEDTRLFAFLDDARNEFFIDDVKINILKKGFDTEVCWGRLSGLGDKVIKAVLLNEPKQDLGIHKGDEIAFQVAKESDNSNICICNLDNLVN